MIKTRLRTELIYIFLKSSDMALKEFCKKCRISIQTFQKLMDGKQCYSQAILRIAKVIHIRPHQMYEIICDE